VSARTIAISVLVCALGLGACADRTATPAVLPVAEFLVAAGDSTYWVRSSPEGLRVRSAPLLLTRTGDRFFELRIVEDIRDYMDAEFVRERLYGHALGRTDSVLLYADESVADAMRFWLSERPGEEPINPEGEDAPEPASSAADFLEVIDVHGRWVSWAHALDIDLENAPGHTHQRRRGVSDIRSGARAELDSLVSPGEAARIAAIGRASLDTMLAVVRDARDDRAARARETLHTFVFDPASFSITDIERQPAILFHVPGTSADGEALELLLPPIAIAEAPPWWSDVRPTVPAWSTDSSGMRWTHGGYRVVGSVDSARALLTLSLLSDSVGARTWPIAVVPMPAYQFIALDNGALDTGTRAALSLAFDRASADNSLAMRRADTSVVAPRRVLLTTFRFNRK
jgi:hypothetical protein